MFLSMGLDGRFKVALRKESVDRNEGKLDADLWVMWSLSARRAWIEINTRNQPGKPKAVALRKESVDRNRTPHHKNTRPIPSLSARRAWIEIRSGETLSALVCVALRKESVDRNFDHGIALIPHQRRSPQGERG